MIELTLQPGESNGPNPFALKMMAVEVVTVKVSPVPLSTFVDVHDSVRCRQIVRNYRYFRVIIMSIEPPERHGAAC